MFPKILILTLPLSCIHILILKFVWPFSIILYLLRLLTVINNYNEYCVEIKKQFIFKWWLKVDWSRLKYNSTMWIICGEPKVASVNNLKSSPPPHRHHHYTATAINPRDVLKVVFVRDFNFVFELCIFFTPPW